MIPDRGLGRDTAIGASQQRPKRATRVTSHDLAAEAEGSQATVARVFSSPDKVAFATQEQVRDEAERLGAVPNATARSLKSQRTDVVGAVVPAHSEYWHSVLTAFSRRLAEQGKQLLLFSFVDANRVEAALDSVEQHPPRTARPRRLSSCVEAALDSVEQHLLDGLVLASSTIRLEHLVRTRRPVPRVVAFNQPVASGLLPLVTVDNQARARSGRTRRRAGSARKWL